MVGRLESMPEWVVIRNLMEVLKLLKMIRHLTYSYKGGKKYYHALIEVRRNQVNIQQGEKICKE